MDPVDTVEQLRAAVHRDPRWVAEVASARVPAVRDGGDPAELSRLLAVLGRARRSLGEIDLAESDLREAVVAAARAAPAERAELVADAHLGLAGVLSFAGRSREAFSHLDTAHRRGSEQTRAYVALQRAVIEQRIGHMREALAGYGAALPVLRRLDAHRDAAMVLLNRGVVRTQSGHCDAAIADLTEAGELFGREGHEFGVAQADHGMGWAYARRGDLPRALQLLDRSAERFHRLGHTALEVDVDRVEVLLAAGLFQLARELATGTARRLRAAGNHSQAAETWLLCARACALDGDRAAAGRYAERAWEVFAGQASVGWERAARLELALSGGGARDPEALRGLAADLSDVGNARGAATALALAAVAACEAGARSAAAQLAAESARQARRLGTFDVRMLAAYAQARSAASNGDAAAAGRRIRAGLSGLRRHRATLAATDARAAVAVHAAPLAELGLQLAWGRRAAPAVLRWLELVRAGRGRPRAPRPPGDPALAAGLAELRAVVAQVREREAAGHDTTDLLWAQRELERSVHRRTLRSAAPAGEVGGDWPVVGTGELARVLDGRSLVALAEIGTRLVGVRVGGGRTRLADLGPSAALAPVVATVRSALRARLHPRPSAADRSGVDRLGPGLAVLDRTVAGLLAGDGPVVLVVPAGLHTVPWPLLPCLTGRPVVLAPSATWWYETQTRPVAAAGGGAPAPGAPVAVAGPRLVEAVAEATGVAGGYPGGAVLTGPAATSGAVLSTMATARTVHIASHGRIRRDNPLWSSLELADGPLYVYDVEQLRWTPPLVVLSGCETGVGVRAGDQLLGLSAALLQHGTRCLVAALCALPDTVATRDTMIALHRRIGGGATPAAALAGLAAGGPADPSSLLAASLGCFGSH